jgi:hypothetical protein
LATVPDDAMMNATSEGLTDNNSFLSKEKDVALKGK